MPTHEQEALQTRRVTVEVPAALQAFTSGSPSVAVEATTVGDALRAVEDQHPGILARIVTPDGSVRPLVNIYLGDVDIRALDGLRTPLSGGATILVIPAVVGG